MSRVAASVLSSISRRSASLPPTTRLTPTNPLLTGSRSLPTLPSDQSRGRPSTNFPNSTGWISKAVASVFSMSRRSASLPPPARLTSTNPFLTGSGSQPILPDMSRGRSSTRGNRSPRHSSVDGTTHSVPIQVTGALEEQDRAYTQLIETPEDSKREWNRRMPSDHLVVYTDGSYKNNRSGFGIYMGPGHELNRSVKVTDPPHNSQRPEILAIILALKNILTWPNYNNQPVIVRTDALYAVQAISGIATLPTYSDEIEEIRTLSSQIGGSVQFEHVYAHDDDPGNEAADELARQAVLGTAREGRSRSRKRDRSREYGRSRSKSNNKDHIRTHSTNIPGCSSAA